MEGVPVIDTAWAKPPVRGSKTRPPAPNFPGVLPPGECRIGVELGPSPASIGEPPASHAARGLG
jgi:hypothetical protein